MKCTMSVNRNTCLKYNLHSWTEIQRQQFSPSRSTDSVQSQSQYQQGLGEGQRWGKDWSIDSFLVKLDKLVPKFMQKNKGPRISKTLFKKHKMRGFALPDIKTYYKAVVIQTVWHKDKQIVQWKRPVALHISGERGTSQSMELRRLIYICGGGGEKSEPYLTSYTNIHSRYIKDLNVKRKTFRNKYRNSSLIIHKFVSDQYVVTSTAL